MFLRALLFCVGWTSGGGFLALGAMLLLEAMFGTDYNTWFVAGCLWGTFGVFAGLFMARQVTTRTAQPHGGK